MEFTKTTVTLLGLLLSLVVTNFATFNDLGDLNENGSVFQQSSSFSGFCEQEAGKIERRSGYSSRYYHLMAQSISSNSPKKDVFGFTYANLCDSCSEVSIRKYFFKDLSISQAYEKVVSSYRLPLRLNLPGKDSEDSFDVYNDLELESGRNCYIHRGGLAWVSSSDTYNVPLLLFKEVKDGVEMLYYKRLDV